MRERHNNILERLVKAIPPDLEDKFKEQKLMGFPGDLRSDNSQQRLRHTKILERTVQKLKRFRLNQQLEKLNFKQKNKTTVGNFIYMPNIIIANML